MLNTRIGDQNVYEIVYKNKRKFFEIVKFVNKVFYL